MVKPAESHWSKFARAQPSVTEHERAPGVAARAESFIIEMSGENLVLKIKREDGRVALVELTPDTAFYLREYLSNALATVGMPEEP